MSFDMRSRVISRVLRAPYRPNLFKFPPVVKVKSGRLVRRIGPAQLLCSEIRDIGVHDNVSSSIYASSVPHFHVDGVQLL